MFLIEYDIQYMTQKDIKGSVLSGYLVHQIVEGYQPINFHFPGEDIMLIRDWNILGPDKGPELGARWKIVFDDSSNGKGRGIGTIITYPTSFHIPFTARLCFDCTNNMVEYEAHIYGVEVTIDLRIKILDVFRDSNLLISQVR